MKPAPFEYRRAASVKEAVALLREHGGDAKVLAGGQSLLPMMKLRLARPAVVVDINRIPELHYVRAGGGRLAFGATARLDTLETDAVRRQSPLLAEAVRHIAHPAIRHRGTVCGSLAHSDPAAELPMLALALDAELVATGPRGERVVPARDFFLTYLTTTLGSDELLTEARFAVPPPASGSAFLELSRRPGDFAIVAVAVVLEASGGTITRARVALGAVADRAVRSDAAEAALVGQPGRADTFEAAARAAAAPLEPPSDVHGSSAYRKHVTSVLVRRALAQAWERATATS
ncbi:MAG: xanthine dehydrogenase family protein subunit M [Candidatus Rokubacteria bacterium]|nr:xanthine dehydrogenase family protein subunit M [Candidatus Rokubacteria bacterium]